jgi:hypothetical protein
MSRWADITSDEEDYVDPHPPPTMNNNNRHHDDDDDEGSSSLKLQPHQVEYRSRCFVRRCCFVG